MNIESIDLRNPVWVDCDPGIDDAFALVALSALHRLERIRLVGVSAVGGNVDVSAVANNAALLLAQCELQHEVPLVVGADPPGRPASRGFHGLDGLGGQYFYSRHLESPIGDGDGDVFRIAEQAAGLTILCLGPLTNVARWLDYPAFRALKPNVVVMGGTAGRGHGNISDNAEFNFYCDPLSAARVLGGADSLTMIPLETTEKVAFTTPQVEPIASRCPWLGSMAEWSAEAHGALSRRLPEDGSFWLHDLVTVVQLVEPDAFTYERANVFLDPDDRGTTVVDRAPSGLVQLATDVSAERVHDMALTLVLDAIEQLPRRLAVR